MRNKEGSEGSFKLSLRLSSAVLMLEHLDVRDKKVQLTVRQLYELQRLLRECRLLVDQERLF